MGTSVEAKFLEIFAPKSMYDVETHTRLALSPVYYAHCTLSRGCILMTLKVYDVIYVLARKRFSQNIVSFMTM